jgi:DNA-binding GntR family transcriptional regulator
MDGAAIDAAILSQTAACAPGSSISPNDVAQALATEWRPLLGAVRSRAAILARDGLIEILRKGKPIDPAEMRGVFRLRAKA